MSENQQLNRNNQLVPCPEPEPEAGGLPPRPRQAPSDLSSLLRMCVSTAPEAAENGGSHLEPMDEERRKFLEEAINSLTINVTAEMISSIEILNNKNRISQILCDSDVPEEVIGAFEFLTEAIMNIDTAIGFHKLNGYSLFPVCFSCENNKVRELACSLLAELCQNNPTCQSVALSYELMPILLLMLKMETEEKPLKAALYAVSSMVRDHLPCTEAFLEKGGYSALAGCISQPYFRVQDKASFLISQIYPRFPCSKKHEILELIKNMGIALENATSEQNPMQVISGLEMIFMSSSINLIADWTAPELKLKESCEKYLQLVTQDPNAFSDEIRSCKMVLNTIDLALNKTEKRDPEKDESVDR